MMIITMALITTVTTALTGRTSGRTITEAIITEAATITVAVFTEGGVIQVTGDCIPGK